MLHDTNYGLSKAAPVYIQAELLNLQIYLTKMLLI